MPTKNDQSKEPRGKGMSRRDFVKLLAAAGLLAGCGPAKGLATPTSAPSPTSTPAPTTIPPTARPTTAPTVTPTLQPTTIPTAVPLAGPSRVVHTRHSGVWDGDTLVPEIIGQMLDVSITTLAGLDDVNAAWASLFDPSEHIVIKVNTIRGSSGWTHVPLVIVVTERLQAMGVPPEQILIFDRYTTELQEAGFPINKDGPGVRCYGTDYKYTMDWTLVDRRIGLSDVLLNCDALINMPIIKQHSMAGISFAMKNHYGTFDRPGSYHPPMLGQAIPELNALPPIRDRERLIVGDALLYVLGDHWGSSAPGESILMSIDPVAIDTVVLPLWSAVREANGGNPAAYQAKATEWLTASAALGLGTNDPKNIDLVEVDLA